MGTWDTGPFGNDLAGDFALLLDHTAPPARADLLRRTLSRPRQALVEDFEVTVAAAAVIAAPCPGGEPTDRVYGPQTALPAPMPASLPALAAAALHQVLLDTRLAASWVSGELLGRWRSRLIALHAVLTAATAPPSGQPPHTGPAPHSQPARPVAPPPAPGSGHH